MDFLSLRELLRSSILGLRYVAHGWEEEGEGKGVDSRFYNKVVVSP